jgi:hypothetical protein
VQNPSLEQHYNSVVKALVDGRLVPFLGAGVNLCGRPADDWKADDCRFLPSGWELTSHLRKAFEVPAEQAYDLSRVSEYVSVMNGVGPLYEELRRVFDSDFSPTPVHRLLASLPGHLREKGYPKRNLLIVTTNYDDVLERSFEECGEEFDLLTYMASGKRRGRFLHTAPGGVPEPIEVPNEYMKVSLETRSVIMKIHGAVDRDDPGGDSYVITEDDYIDYLKHTEVSEWSPTLIAGKLLRSNFLFLGYALRDWNLRVILHRISADQQQSYKSWAILLNPDKLDEQFWQQRQVQIINTRLEEYVAGLNERLESLPPGPGARSRETRA